MSTAAANAAAASLTDMKMAVLQRLPSDPLKTEIARLREEQAQVRKQKKDLSKALRNATKKQQRLRKRTRLMTDEDLVAVLLMRKESAAGALGKTDGTASSDAGMSSGSSGSGGPSSGSGLRSPHSVDGRSRSEEPGRGDDGDAMDLEGDAPPS